jgi:uncharacterized protein YjbI with pentapeptide repeats
MKVAAPKIPKVLQTITDLKTVVLQDTAIQESYCESENIDNMSISSLTVHESRLSKVTFSNSVLERLDFLRVELLGCEMAATNSDEASWRNVYVSGCRASGLSLTNGLFEDVIFDNCRLDLTNFRYSKFKKVIFRDCYMEGADFYHCTMSSVSFERCVLKDVEMSQATLKDVDLRSSEISEMKSINSLVGATISTVQLMQIAPVLAQSLRINVKD